MPWQVRAAVGKQESDHPFDGARQVRAGVAGTQTVAGGNQRSSAIKAAARAAPSVSTGR